jgi:uncharacterized membrane protein (UPF0182 family)
MRRNLLWIILVVFLVVSYLASGTVEFLVDWLWFADLGQGGVFRTIFFTRLALGAGGGALAAVFLYANFAYALRQVGDPSRYLPPELLGTPLGGLMSAASMRRMAVAASLLIGAVTGLAAGSGWQALLLYRYGEAFGAADPVFNRDAAFYIFTMPVLDKVQAYVWTLGVVALIGAGFTYLAKVQSERGEGADVITINSFPPPARWHLALLAAWVLVATGVGMYLDRFSAMHEPGGLFTGPGYADIHATLPLLALKAVTSFVCAGVVLWALPRGRYRDLIGAAVLAAAVWIGGGVYTSVIQRFVVVPNQLEKERPYLRDHIAATNRAFGLEGITERPLVEDDDLTAKDIARNSATVNNVRLWDHEPLLETFSQIQEIRTYYDFLSVDNDRYLVGGELRQMMLSPREMSTAALQSRAWINERLIYTHGYGLTMGPVNRVNEQGLPVLYVKDLPPKSQYRELAIAHPEIYFGELVDDYVFVKTRQEEFNFPEGDHNNFSTYSGSGGLKLDSVYRRLLLSLYLRDFSMLLSNDFTPETRVLLVRNILRRVSKIAPFFRYDRDPYLVIHEGRMKWILDGYTASDRYPYSEQIRDVGNYMRNPVKVVVDAKDGDVTFYLAAPQEPFARAYAAMFPALFRPLADLPAGLKAHLRHPEDLFSVQAAIYATYHMTDVNTFYNKEDLWSIPVVGQKRMLPYFTVMKLPGENKEEFILMLPFTPRGKDNLAAWMVARMDGPHYGKLIVYTFPKQRLIFGPKQMVGRINQDPEVSQQITLWESSGSSVIRGTLLVIPIENSLIYVQPIYLKAVDGRIPELKRVVVGYQNEIAMAEDLEGALSRIFSGRRPQQRASPQAAAALAPSAPAAAPHASALPPSGRPSQSLARQALGHYNAMAEAARGGDWARFGRELELLGQKLRELAK